MNTMAQPEIAGAVKTEVDQRIARITMALGVAIVVAALFAVERMGEQGIGVSSAPSLTENIEVSGLPR